MKVRSSFDHMERRLLPAYTPAQAAVYLCLPVATVRAWAIGQHGGGERSGFVKPVIEPRQHQGKLAFSFVNLVELHVLGAVRRILDVPLPKLRRSIDHLAHRCGGIKNPLADLDLLTDGLDLWLDELGSFSGKVQTDIHKVMEPYLRRVDREPGGRAVRLFPFRRSAAPAEEDRTVMIDPEVSFGRPVLMGTGIPTRTIADRFNAGDTIHDLAEDYNRSPEENRRGDPLGAARQTSGLDFSAQEAPVSQDEKQPTPDADRSAQSKQFLPEIVIALVRAIGTDVSEAEQALESLFRSARYEVHPIKLSKLFSSVPRLRAPQQTPKFEYYRTHMNAGDLLRGVTGREDAAALLAVKEIARFRRESKARKNPETRGRAYILSSLMHPAEVSTLRQIYGAQLFVISLFSHRKDREDRLTAKLAESSGSDDAAMRPKAIWLMKRDVGELKAKEIDDAEVEAVLAKRPKALLNVGKTFEHADLFVSSAEAGLPRELERFVHLIFRHPFHTPTRHEFGMTMAYAARLRSASLSRQVGAAIVSDDSEVIALGTNEVPKYGGGAYWPGDQPDKRDFQLGYDTSDRLRRELISDLISRLCNDPTWVGIPVAADLGQDENGFRDKVVAYLKSLNVEDAVDCALLESGSVLDSKVMDVLEYGRAVHAEMLAITDAARRGVSLAGTSLYCTTFPCHECARHIVAAGIKNVYYIEPYPKSKVTELYADSIRLEDGAEYPGDRVSFRPFVGISPLRYVEFFTAVRRKKVDIGQDPKRRGYTVDWELANAKVRSSILSKEALKSGVRELVIRFGERHFTRALDSVLRQWDAEEARSGEKL